MELWIICFIILLLVIMLTWTIKNGTIEGNVYTPRILSGYLLYPSIDFEFGDIDKMTNLSEVDKLVTKNVNAIAFNTNNYVKGKINYGKATKANCDTYIKISKGPQAIPKILHQIWI